MLRRTTARTDALCGEGRFIPLLRPILRAIPSGGSAAPVGRHRNQSHRVSLRTLAEDVARSLRRLAQAGPPPALLLPGLSARTSLASSDGEYTNYPAGRCPLEVQTAATTRCSLTGRRLASLPRFAITAGLDYQRPVGDAQVFVHVDTASRSGFNGDPSLSRFTYIRGYNLTNANIGYRFADGLEVIVWARNLLDADYIQNLTIQAGNSGLIVGTPSDPRIIGGTIRFRM